MDEKIKADIYIAYLDKILAGEKDIGPVDDVEIEELLLLAKTMVADDFSINNETKENFRKRLIAQVTKKNSSSLRMLSKNDDELDEEALEYVAAGFGGQAGEQMDICPYCGSSLKKLTGKCPGCNH